MGDLVNSNVGMKDGAGPGDGVSKPRRTRHRVLSQPRAEETRARILQKAREVFAEDGFAGTNLRKIAAEAGVTHSMVTYHFGTKDNLWREAVRDMFALIEGQVFDPFAAELAAGLPDREVMKNLVRRYTRYSAEHPEHSRLTISETIRGGERLEWMARTFVAENHASSLPWLEGLMARGVIRKAEPMSLLFALVGMVQMPFVLAKEALLVSNYDFLTDEAIERHAEAVITFLLTDEASGPE